MESAPTNHRGAVVIDGTAGGFLQYGIRYLIIKGIKGLLTLRGLLRGKFFSSFRLHVSTVEVVRCK